ncbi:MAG: flagellar motor switch protein FliM [Proteobacteria bacterium]|nr:flagellar motor switch protein FliM [Pseudomonadota bacterium]MBU4011276.1 flagellar motor switch protein FliM [Pseudomonadota bacterium]MBU4036646.1 flagellar motor switch protein FliM [Pseudomonadota bacterium]
MANILSQEEVDSLLGGIDEGSVETETDVSEIDGDVALYDFGKKSSPGHLRLPALGMVNERFINLLNESLPGTVGLSADVCIDEIDSIKFGDFCRSLPVPTSLNIFKMEPLKGFALLVFEGWLVFAFVDAMFGGKGVSHVKLEGRGFTAIEKKIVSRIVDVVLVDLQKAWADIKDLKMICTRSEMDPQFAGIAKPTDMIIATRFAINIGNFTGGMTICLPYDVIEPIGEKLKANFRSESFEPDKTWRKYIENKVRELNINLTCTLGKIKITGREFLEMKANDVLLTNQKVDDPVVVSVGNTPKLEGYIGSMNNKKAIRVSEIKYSE